MTFVSNASPSRHLPLIFFFLVGCGGGIRRTGELPHCRLARAAPPPGCTAPSVSGTVVAAETGEPIAGAEVLVGDGTVRTTSGPDGAFALCGLATSPAGLHLTLRYRDGSAETIVDRAEAVVAAEVREERWPTYIDPSVRRPRPGPDRLAWRVSLCAP